MDLSNFDILILFFSTFLTSVFTGVLGQGGGLILFAVLAVYIELPLLIAFHGIIQIFSNASRAYFALPHIKWPIIQPILIGTIIGAILITPLIKGANWSWLEPVIGLFILQQVWFKLPIPIAFPKPLFSAGILQGTLGMIFGATGPLANTLLFKQGLSKDQIVASNAVIMTTSHVIKVILFLFIGVSIIEQIWMLAILGVLAIAGSKFGTIIRGKVPEDTFMTIFKWTLTLLALRMLLSSVF